MTLADGRNLRVPWRGTPTGVLLHEGYVITRHHDSDPEGSDVILLDRTPSGEDVRAHNRTQYLTHSRVIVVRDTVITEAAGCRSMMSRQPDGTYEPMPTPEGLAVRDLRAPDEPLRVVHVKDCPRVTAIAALPGNHDFLTGGNRGEIDRWAWDGAWQQHRWRGPANPKSKSLGTREADSIVGIVSLAESHDVVAVTAGRGLLVLREGRESERERLSHRGAPRSLAAHPHKPWVAVGIKQGGWNNPQSVVAIVAVERRQNIQPGFRVLVTKSENASVATGSNGAGGQRLHEGHD